MFWFILEFTIGQVWKNKRVKADDADSAKSQLPRSAKNIKVWKTL